MIRRFILSCLLLILFTCNDGDILTVELDFDQNLEYCDNNINSFLIYDTRQDPDESLSVIIQRENDDVYPFTEATPIGEPLELSLTSADNRFLYRTYNRSIGNNELCEIVPPANLNIIENYEATAGTIEITVTIEDDDGDGIPSDLEGRGDIDENGEYPNAQDSDNDGIPDYLDEDDDNDNVKTEFEIDEDNLDEDNDPTTNPLDTDEDGTPDYLDEDDDGDGIDTIEEDEDGDKNPINDRNNNAEGVLVPHYLNPLENTLYNNPGNTTNNSFTRTVTANFIVRNINLEILSATEIDLGTLTYPITFTQEEEED